jgi:hypothetical protein
LSDNIDVGVALPLLRNSVQGTSNAEIQPFGGPTAAHFFAGTTENPVLQATRTTEGSAFGIGDVAARLKINARQSANGGAAFLVDARLPTGDEQDLLGAGAFSGRFLGILSSTFGNFSPHMNAGYLLTLDDDRNDAVLATVGFDHLLAPGWTLAADVISEFQVGESQLKLPQPVQYDWPFHRTINPTSIPDIRDDVIDGSFGIKYTTPGRLTTWANALFPLNDGSLRSRLTWTIGLEYAY